MADKESFGQQLRKLLKEKKLSQQNVADELNLPRNTIWRWINGQATPESNNLQNLATLLNISVDELLNGVPEQNAWVLQIKIAQEFKEEVIDMTQNVPCISSITVTPKGGVFSLGGDYSLWTDDKKFKDLINNIKKTRDLIIQNGRALGGIKD